MRSQSSSRTRPTPEIVFDQIERYQPTIFFAVPTIYVPMLAQPGAKQRDLRSLRLCVSAAEALIRGEAALAKHNGRTHEQVRSRFQQLDRQILELNRRYLAAKLHKRSIPVGTRAASVRDYTDYHVRIGWSPVRRAPAPPPVTPAPPTPPPPVAPANRPPVVKASCQPCTVIVSTRSQVTADASDPDGEV